MDRLFLLGTDRKTYVVNPPIAPVRGVDYWTESDQEAIIQQVITALGTPVFGRVDADNNIILTGELAEGTYTIKYEDADGEVTDIGTVVVGGMGDSGSIALVWTDNVNLDKNTGAESASNGEYAASQHIALVDGYTYTFNQNGYGGVNICYYDADGAGLGYELLWDGVDGVKSKALTPIAGAATFRIRLYYGVNQTVEDVKERYALTYQKTAYTNLFDPATASLNTRMSGSSKTPKTENGYVMTASIPITATQVASSAVSSFVAVPKSMWSGSANMFLGMGEYTTQGMCGPDATIDEIVGDWVKIPLRNQFGNAFACDSVILSLNVKAGSAITASDIQNVEIYFNEIPE